MLPAVIDALIAAVRADELDDLFKQAAKADGLGKLARPSDHSDRQHSASRNWCISRL
jgi:hypothetical protein